MTLAYTGHNVHYVIMHRNVQISVCIEVVCHFDDAKRRCAAYHDLELLSSHKHKLQGLWRTVEGGEACNAINVNLPHCARVRGSRGMC